MFTAGGRDADEVQTADIERFIGQVKPEDIRKIEYGEAVSRGLVREFYPMNEYLDDIMEKIDMEAIKPVSYTHLLHRSVFTGGRRFRGRLEDAVEILRRGQERRRRL